MFEAVQCILAQAVEETIIHGFTLSVGKGDRQLFFAKGGHLGGGESPQVTEHTRYDLDALTQGMVTAPLVLLALEKGLLSLDDSISLYVESPEDKQELTLRHLLSHTGGMTSGFLLEQEAENAADSLRALLAHPLEFPAGKRTRRSGMGFLLLGKLLERVYGMALDAAAKKFIFSPLGLAHTGYLATGEDIAITALHPVTGEPQAGMPGDGNTRFLHGVSGAAGVFSNAGDCHRFLAMLASGGKSNDHLFLTPDALRLLSTDYTPGLKDAWGLGFRLATRDTSFMGDLWPKNSFGLTGDTGTAWAVSPGNGIHVTLLSNRARSAHESRSFSRFLRLALSSAYADALRTEASI